MSVWWDAIFNGVIVHSIQRFVLINDKWHDQEKYKVCNTSNRNNTTQHSSITKYKNETKKKQNLMWKPKEWRKIEKIKERQEMKIDENA